MRTIALAVLALLTSAHAFAQPADDKAKVLAVIAD